MACPEDFDCREGGFFFLPFTSYRMQRRLLIHAIDFSKLVTTVGGQVGNTRPTGPGLIFDGEHGENYRLGGGPSQVIGEETDFRNNGQGTLPIHFEEDLPNESDGKGKDNVSYDECALDVLGDGCAQYVPGGRCSQDVLGDGGAQYVPGDGCAHDEPGDGCAQDVLGDRCAQDVSGDGCALDVPGDGCALDVPGDGCAQDVPGDGCAQDVPGDGCTQDMPGDGGAQDVPGDGCTQDVPGDGNALDVLGDGCTHDVPGDGCAQDMPGDGYAKHYICLRFSCWCDWHREERVSGDERTSSDESKQGDEENAELVSSEQSLSTGMVREMNRRTLLQFNRLGQKDREHPSDSGKIINRKGPDQERYKRPVIIRKTHYNNMYQRSPLIRFFVVAFLLSFSYGVEGKELNKNHVGQPVSSCPFKFIGCPPTEQDDSTRDGNCEACWGHCRGSLGQIPLILYEKEEYSAKLEFVSIVCVIVSALSLGCIALSLSTYVLFIRMKKGGIKPNSQKTISAEKGNREEDKPREENKPREEDRIIKEASQHEDHIVIVLNQDKPERMRGATESENIKRVPMESSLVEDNTEPKMTEMSSGEVGNNSFKRSDGQNTETNNESISFTNANMHLLSENSRCSKTNGGGGGGRSILPVEKVLPPRTKSDISASSESSCRVFSWERTCQSKGFQNLDWFESDNHQTNESCLKSCHVGFVLEDGLIPPPSENLGFLKPHPEDNPDDGQKVPLKSDCVSRTYFSSGYPIETDLSWQETSDEISSHTSSDLFNESAHYKPKINVVHDKKSTVQVTDVHELTELSEGEEETKLKYTTPSTTHTDGMKPNKYNTFANECLEKQELAQPDITEELDARITLVDCGAQKAETSILDDEKRQEKLESMLKSTNDSPKHDSKTWFDSSSTSGYETEKLSSENAKSLGRESEIDNYMQETDNHSYRHALDCVEEEKGEDQYQNMIRYVVHYTDLSIELPIRSIVRKFEKAKQKRNTEKTLKRMCKTCKRKLSYTNTKCLSCNHEEFKCRPEVSATPQDCDNAPSFFQQVSILYSSLFSLKLQIRKLQDYSHEDDLNRNKFVEDVKRAESEVTGALNSLMKEFHCPRFIIDLRSFVQEVIPLVAFPALKEYFERLEQGPISHEESMSYEWLRLASLDTYRGAASAIQLARNGFYHDVEQGPTATRCHACKLLKTNWEFFDNIEEEHRRLSPNCRLHQAGTSGNVSIDNQPERNAPEVTEEEPVDRNTTPEVNESSEHARNEVANITENLQGTQIPEMILEGPQQPTEDRYNHEFTSWSTPRTVSGQETSSGPPEGTGRAHQQNTGASVGAQDSNNTATNITVTSENSSSQRPRTQVATSTPFATGAGKLRERNQGNGGFSAGDASQGVNDPSHVNVLDPKYGEYSSVDSRAASFTSMWPSYLDQTPRQMAQAGFFYAGVADFTRCFACGGGLRNWEAGDDPCLEHTRWYPRCEYMNKLKGSVYVQAVIRRQEEHAAEQRRRQQQQRRQQTPSNTPPDPLTTPAAAVLIEMGYTSERAREAILAVRRNTGHNSVSAEQALVWILDRDELSELTASEAPTATQPTVTTTSQSSATAFNQTSTSTQGSSSATQISSASSQTSSTTVTSASGGSSKGLESNKQGQGALVTGATGGSRSSTPTRSGSNSRGDSKSENKPGEKDTQKKGANGQGNQPSGKQKKKNGKKKGKGGGAGNNGGEADANEEKVSESVVEETVNEGGAMAIKGNNSREMVSAGEPTEKDTSTLKAENKKLREMQTCKICMDKPVNMTLLPCGHLVCCESCSPHLRKCPICRRRIEGSVKTFMS